MRATIIVTLISILLPITAWAEKPVPAVESLDQIKVIKISPDDMKAVVKNSKGKLVMLKPGDRIGKNGKITEIAKGRIVIEEQLKKGIETVIIRIKDGKQTVERISSFVEQPSRFYLPRGANETTAAGKNE